MSTTEFKFWGPASKPASERALWALSWDRQWSKGCHHVCAMTGGTSLQHCPRATALCRLSAGRDHGAVTLHSRAGSPLLLPTYKPIQFPARAQNTLILWGEIGPWDLSSWQDPTLRQHPIHMLSSSKWTYKAWNSLRNRRIFFPPCIIVRSSMKQS